MYGIQLFIRDVIKRRGNIVPPSQKAGKKVHGHQGLCQRKHHLKQDLKIRRSVNLGGLDHGPVDAHKKCAEQKNIPGCQAGQQINENVVFTAPSISQRAALHALRNRERIQPPMVEEYRKRLYFAAEKINSIKGLSAGYPPCGSFYLFVNIKKTGMSSRDFADFLLEKAHVLVLPGSAFGQSGEGYVRIACTVGIPQLTEAAKRIENALDQLKEQDRDKYE